MRIFITFCLVTFAWIFFRAENLHEAGIVINKITQVPQDISQFFVIKGNLGIKEAIRALFALNDDNFGGFSGMIKLFAILCIFILCELKTQRRDGITLIKSKSLLIRWILYTLFVYILLISINLSSNTEFLYFAF